MVVAATTTPTQRDKRSFPWPFSLGGGEEAAATAEVDGQVEQQPASNIISETYNTPAEYYGQPSVVRQPFLVNNQPQLLLQPNQIVGAPQVHYPIWRVHKYNGIDLKPMPISMLMVQPPFPPPPPAQAPTEIIHHQEEPVPSAMPSELLDLARSLGVRDLSRLPSLDEAANLLGTTTQAETIEVIKELAATANGQELIRQFLQNENSVDDSRAEEVDAQNVAQEQTNQPILVQGAEHHQHLDAGDVAPHHETAETAAPVGFFGSITNFFTGSEPAQQEQQFPVQFNQEPSPPVQPSQQLYNFVELLPAAPALPSIPVPAHFPLPSPSTIGSGGHVRFPYPLTTSYNSASQYPAADAITATRSATPPQQAAFSPILVAQDFNHLPLEVDSNYEVFRNSPRIETSENIPELPYTYQDVDATATGSEIRSVYVEPPHQEEAGVINVADEQQQQTDVDDSQIPSVQRRSGATVGLEATVLPQRISSYDFVANGRLSRADAAAVQRAIPTQATIVGE